MSAPLFLLSYLRWHYTVAFFDLYYISKNYLWSVGHIFSITSLLRTLFVPWRRLGSHTTTFFHNPAEFLGDLLVNVIMRLFGFVVRVFLILLALLAGLIVVLLSLLVAIFWAVLPMVVLSLMIYAFSQLFL